ncbi:unnamed protein product [Blepharisma stoltei]|uniref:ALA-interacting subunit n=1 Tax=Blepharisma stoltei TaxID=1481888 RepID=A0AAU9IGD5_9CILI|nr:unnamed protein product [Blepharisma stoltei]
MQEQSRKPKGGWRQLEFRYVMCIPTSLCAICIFAVVFVISLILGAVLLSYSYQIVDYKARYDDICEDKINKICPIRLNFTDKLSKPVYLYFELKNYFQNHRKYVKSYCQNQLADKSYDSSSCQYCSPYLRADDYPDDKRNKITKLDGVSKFKDHDIVNPCGLIAFSLFRDKFYLIDKSGNNITIEDNDIHWFTDDDSKYKNSDDYKQKQYKDFEDPHFKVWMRTSATSTVRKLYGKIDKNLDGKDMWLNISNYEDYSDFDGEKWVIFSTTTGIGGKNLVLGWSLIVIAILSMVWIIAFSLIAYSKKSVDLEAELKKLL